MSRITELGDGAQRAARGESKGRGAAKRPPEGDTDGFWKRRDIDPRDAEVARRLAEGLAALPPVGVDFLGFHLASELGRGAFSRVFLARQTELADRPVALKVAVDLFGEPQMLAQLQHTNIVPIYSAHRAGPLQAVCMPYFGPTTLADVLKGLRGRTALPEFGDALVSMVRGTLLQASPGVQSEPPRPVRATVRMLEGMSYVRALLWVAARVADGLAHAHERGILHRDLKPANILLSDDGQPMLLDFNLSEDVKQRGRGTVSLLGGTLPYMAPEHLDAFCGGAGVFDARSDIYSLGVILYEMLAGRPPFEVPPGQLPDVLPALLKERRCPLPPLRHRNRAVSPAVESIVRRCLDPEPGRRYQTAQELREDLQCQLEDRPLRHAPEPSLRERAGKWARRHPRLSSPVTLGALLAIVAALWVVPAAWFAWEESTAARSAAEEKTRQAAAETQHSEERRQQAETKAERLAQEKQEAEAEAVRLVGEERKAESKRLCLARYRRFREGLAGLGKFEDNLTVRDLVLKEILPIQGNAGEDVERWRGTLRHYRVLENPDWQAAPEVRNLPRAEQQQLRHEVGDLLYLLGRAALLRRPAGPIALARAPAAALAAARVYNERAKGCYARGAAPAALLMQEAFLTEALDGDTGSVKGLRERAREIEPATTRERYRWAGELATIGSSAASQEALEDLKDVTRKEPQRFGAWLLKALCHRQLAQYDEAEEACTSCLALKPDYTWASFYRGLVRLEKEAWAPAESDLEKVLASEPPPTLSDSARVLRARALIEQRKDTEAREVLDRLLKDGYETTEVYVLRAELRSRNWDPEGARRDRGRAAAMEPDTARGWVYRGLARSATRAGAEAALGDFDNALGLVLQYPLALKSKAEVLARGLGRPREAIHLLCQLVQDCPADIGARLDRACLLARLGLRNRAWDDIKTCLAKGRTPSTCYRVGAVYALIAAGQPKDFEYPEWFPKRARDFRERAVKYLSYALRSGYGLDRIDRDPDLAALRADPAFNRLRAAVRDLGTWRPDQRPEE